MTEKVLHVLGLSGGKDSAALAIYMRDNYPEIDMTYYFTDTGKELPEVIDLIDKLEGYVGKKIVDPWEELKSENTASIREKKDFDYWLKQHNNYLPSPQARWCTIQMKLVPFEKWITSYLDKGYKIISYVGIRHDEPLRTGYEATSNKNIETVMPFRDDGLVRQDIYDILQNADLFHDTEQARNNPLSSQAKGLPGYYDWRSRSGCTFCFYQRKIEWLRLLEKYPESFAEAEQYEKRAEDERPDGTFYWLGKGTPLSTLREPKRQAQILADHEKKMQRFMKKRRINVLQVDVDDLDRDFMDEIYDEQEGGGACVTCYK
ncbi:hypothetical protein BCS96_09165 [Vibrio breoganii]|uniref:phosphoadenosine phosphosulfate reductase domain-containing protein n=1 Tax=Vibrio breoganii TaxID=553239 RepID=UPI000C85FA1C|nr:phosphoadenosine phosphosulfate reductase family protein [Vibrio breoganii]PML88777.1 hypothetical protein BCT68_04675 [Vibrio breoganii]PMO99884.1 hypothetical protein BCS96_09165 [Vibrio breoganii]